MEERGLIRLGGIEKLRKITYRGNGVDNKKVDKYFVGKAVYNNNRVSIFENSTV